MSYDVSYSTLPVFAPNSIGYTTKPAPRFINASSWWAVPNIAPITLTLGVYIITFNVDYNNSPNSYAYILLNNPTNNSIFYNGSSYEMLNAFNTYQGTNPSTGGEWNNFTNWYPVAGQQMRNGVSGSSCALSISCVVQITQPNTQCVGIAYNNSNSIACYTINTVRIA